MTSPVPGPRWRGPLLVFAGLAAVLLLLYRDSFASMVGLWLGSENYAHAVVVPPIALWLIWQRRALLRTCTPRPAPLFLLPLLLTLLVWAVGDLSSTNALVHFSVVLSLVLLVPAVLGVQVTRVLAFPLAFLFFAVPFGEFLFPLMMDATAAFTVAALRLSGIPVYREGLHFVIPSGNWSVIEACSGLRYLIASVMVGALFGYLSYQSLRKRLIFFVAAIITPLVANWLRAYMIVMIGHLSGNRLAVGVDHLIYGWVFFGFVMLLLFLVGGRYADDPADDNQAAPAPQVGVAGTPSTARLAGAGALALLILLLPQGGIAWIERQESRAPAALAALPAAAGGWRAEAVAPAAWEPRFLSPAAVLQQNFGDAAGRQVELYVGYYRQQDAQSKLISSENQLVSSKDERWAVARQGAVRLDTAGGALDLRETELRGIASGLQSPQRRLAWELYWVNGQWTASDARAKLYGAVYRLLGRGDDGARLVFSTELTPDGDAAALLAGFVRENLSLIERQLRLARGDVLAPNN